MPGPKNHSATLGAQARPKRAVRRTPGARTPSRRSKAAGFGPGEVMHESYLVGSCSGLGCVRKILLLSKRSRTAGAGSTAVPGVRDPHSQRCAGEEWRRSTLSAGQQRPSPARPGSPRPAPAWRAACHAPTGPALVLPAARPAPIPAPERLGSLPSPPRHLSCTSLPVGGSGTPERASPAPCVSCLATQSLGLFPADCRFVQGSSIWAW